MRSIKSKAVILFSAVMVVGLCLSGCTGEMGWWNFFDPSRPIKKPEQGTVNPIFTQVGPTDQTMELVPNATFPTPEDLRYVEEDYIVGPTDLLRISVLDLLQNGVETIMERQVSHSGYIDLLLAGNIKVAGLTKDQVAERIAKVYQPDILKDPNVSVMVVAPHQNVFSALGAVSRPGTYGILRRDFTLLEALALAGDISQTNIEWIYVIRPKKELKPAAPSEEKIELPPLPTIPTVEPAARREPPEQTTKPAETAPPTRPAATSPAKATGPKSKPAPTTQEKLREMEKLIPLTTPDTEPVLQSGTASVGSEAPSPSSAPADLKGAAVTYKWVYSNGRWIRVPQATAPRQTPKTETTPPTGDEQSKPAEDRFGWGKYDMSHTTRIIAVNLPRLKAGDPRMNIIIHNNDVIHVPVLEVGEFYVMGEVLRPGVYSLTGRRVTAKMAVAAAGNLGPLAWPNNSILIRRVGRDQEQIMPLKLQDIFHGREPDVFLKPNDVIAVGSYWAAPLLAVWRNAFRMTYGFGFIYDRNYSEYEFEIPLIAPKSDMRKAW